MTATVELLPSPQRFVSVEIAVRALLTGLESVSTEDYMGTLDEVDDG